MPTMAKTDTVTESAPAPAPAPVGFAPTNTKRMADDARNLVAMLRAANEEKGDKRIRAVTRVRTLAACVLANFTLDPALESAARGARIGVEVVGKDKGEVVKGNESHPIYNVVQSITLGGTLSGSRRLA